MSTPNLFSDIGQIFFEAIKQGQLEQMKSLLLKSPSLLQFQDHDLITPLHVAAQSGKIKVLEFLIQKSTEKDLIVCDRNGRNVLHYATLSGILECVKFIVEKSTRKINFLPEEGSSKRKPLFTSPILYKLDKEKKKPSDLAIIKGYGSIVLYLCQKELELVNEEELDRPLQGYLLKLGAKGFVKTYKKRWFKQDGDKLYYFKGPEDSESLGFIDLSVFKVSSTPELKKDVFQGLNPKGLEDMKPFQINTPSRLYNLIAPSEAECDRWVRQLSKLGEKEKQKKGSSSNYSPTESKDLLGVSRIQEDSTPGWKQIHFAVLNNKIQDVEDQISKNKNCVNFKTVSHFTALHLACTLPNSLEIIKLLISNGADVNATSEFGQTPLHIGSSVSFSLVEMLLKNKAQVNVVDKNGITPLQITVLRGDLESCQILLDSGASLKIEFSGYSEIEEAIPPLIGASAKGFDKIVSLLLEKGADPNEIDSYGFSSLIYAANNNYPKIVQLLLENDGDPNQLTPDGLTPLHYAASKGHKSVIQILAEKQKDLNITNLSKRTALHIAVIENQIEIIQILLSYGVDVNFIDSQQKTPLHLAAIQGCSEIIALLIENDAVTTIQDVEGCIPLHYACGTKIASVNYLLMSKECVSCINLPNKYGFTPLIIATIFGGDDIIELLINCGANVNVKDAKGKSPLHYSVIKGHRKACEILIGHGADVEARDNDGETAYSLTQQHPDSEAVINIVKSKRDANISRALGSPEKQGFLSKQSSAFHKQYQNKWFILKDDTLYYFKSPDQVNSNSTDCGSISLKECQLTEKNKDKLGFELVSKNLITYIKAPDPTQYSEWISLLSNKLQQIKGNNKK